MRKTQFITLALMSLVLIPTIAVVPVHADDFPITRTVVMRIYVENVNSGKVIQVAPTTVEEVTWINAVTLQTSYTPPRAYGNGLYKKAAKHATMADATSCAFYDAYIPAGNTGHSTYFDNGYGPWRVRVSVGLTESAASVDLYLAIILWPPA